jgi:dolichol-phosphate mannosyltransferase
LLATAQNYDLVIGSRYMSGSPTVKNWPFYRLVMSRMANLYLHVMTSARVDDATSGFRCWRASFIRKFPLRQLQAGGFAFLYETLFYAGTNSARITEVQNIYRGRTYGESKMNSRIIIESLWVPFRLRAGHVKRKLFGNK